MTLQRQTIAVEGIPVHLIEAGDGPPVLLLHGWPTHSGLYRNILPVIAPYRRAIAIDLPGFGASGKPQDASYSFRFFDRVLDGVLDALHVSDVGLVVHDLGGPIGMHWATQNIGRVRELVMLNTVVFPDMSWMVKAFVLSTMVPGIRRMLSSPAGIRASMRFGVVDRSRINDAVAALYQAPFSDRAARKALLKTAHSLHPRGFETITEALPRFTMPVRLIYGEDDRILPDVAKTMARICTILPHATMTSIPNCGHFLQEDRPEQVAALLAEFFADAMETPA
ncbi:MAG: alpha/beta fold hydrolase [Myxococcota bacterium]